MLLMRELEWEKIHSYLLDCGSIREPREFAVKMADKMYSLISYDQARIYFLDNNMKIVDEVLFGVDEYWSQVYIKYYSQSEDYRYSLRRDLKEEDIYPEVYDWSIGNNDFISDYIKPQGLRHSIGFGLNDSEERLKCVCAFDRTSFYGYTDKDLATMNVIMSHLENLHKNLFVQSSKNDFIVQKKMEDKASLSPRESEIARLLCDGLTPNNIGEKLYISVSTVYRHIANMHKKLNVSNRQELLLKLINDFY